MTDAARHRDRRDRRFRHPVLKGDPRMPWSTERDSATAQAPSAAAPGTSPAQSSGAEVLLRVDPAPLLAQADLAPLLSAPPVDGRYLASDGDLVTLALRQGVRQRSGVYQFLWQPSAR